MVVRFKFGVSILMLPLFFLLWSLMYLINYYRRILKYYLKWKFNQCSHP